MKKCIVIAFFFLGLHCGNTGIFVQWLESSVIQYPQMKPLIKLYKKLPMDIKTMINSIDKLAQGDPGTTAMLGIAIQQSEGKSDYTDMRKALILMKRNIESNLKK